MPKLRPFLAALLLALGAAAPALAQRGVVVDSAARVRVKQAEVGTVVGALLAADSLSLTLDPAAGGMGSSLLIPVADVRRMDVSLGVRTPSQGAWRGLKKGFLTGVVLSGAIIAAAAIEDEQDPCGDCFFNATLSAVIISVPLTGATTLLGTVWGAAAPGERWRRVQPPVYVAPAP
ncbi:MAG TPA: hypothetical protein VHG91_16230 [Longimicrobium sp.]|nr:hypothetical protein [Longimicrobium sp.]